MHIVDDAMNDGFMWCGQPPSGLYIETRHSPSCLLCIVKQAKYMER